MGCSVLRRTWWQALARRAWLSLLHANDPWIGGTVDVRQPAVRRMIARARLDRMRAAGTMVCWDYSRDRIVEQRELRLEPTEQKAARVAAARRGRETTPDSLQWWERKGA